MEGFKAACLEVFGWLGVIVGGVWCCGWRGMADLYYIHEYYIYEYKSGEKICAGMSGLTLSSGPLRELAQVEKC